MSRANPDDYDRLLLTFSCLRCGAPAGSWCLAKSDKQATHLHAPRFWAARKAQPEALDQAAAKRFAH